MYVLSTALADKPLAFCVPVKHHCPLSKEKKAKTSVGGGSKETRSKRDKGRQGLDPFLPFLFYSELQDGLVLAQSNEVEDAHCFILSSWFLFVPTSILQWPFFARGCLCCLCCLCCTFFVLLNPHTTLQREQIRLVALPSLQLLFEHVLNAYYLCVCECVCVRERGKRAYFYLFLQGPNLVW